MTAGIRVSVTQPSAPASMEHCHLVFFDYLTSTIQLFLPGPDDFCWGPAPVGPTLVTGSCSLRADSVGCMQVACMRKWGQLHWITECHCRRQRRNDGVHALRAACMQPVAHDRMLTHACTRLHASLLGPRQNVTPIGQDRVNN